jgi:hypothetical protein
MTGRWKPGDQIAVRWTGSINIALDGEAMLPVSGTRPGIMQGWPHVVVEDRDDLLALWMPAGSRPQFVDLAARDAEPITTVWRTDVLRLCFPGRTYSIWLRWTADTHTFTSWYVNLEAPFVRTPVGIDTTDNSLDLVIAPDFTWRWKDEFLTKPLEEIGVFSSADTESFYATGREVLADMEARRFPFDGSYLNWRPDPNWSIPELHPGWDRVPGYDVNLTTGRRLTGVDHPR